MKQDPTNSSGAVGRPQAHPVLALRDHLTQTVTATNQLRSILAMAEDPGRRFGENG